jgi:hypothetical protein
MQLTSLEPYVSKDFCDGDDDAGTYAEAAQERMLRVFSVSQKRPLGSETVPVDLQGSDGGEGTDVYLMRNVLSLAEELTPTVTPYLTELIEIPETEYSSRFPQ